jgi:hypothetical protein
MCALMIVKQWSPSQTLDEIDLNTSPFWVKIHGLPLKKRILKTAIVVGKGLGKLLEVENLEASGVICRHHLRVRVEIDIRKPLVPGFSFALEDSNPVWIQLKYERLADYSISCGLTGHR